MSTRTIWIVDKDIPEVVAFVDSASDTVRARFAEQRTCKMEQIPECQYDDIACSECGVELLAFSMDKEGEGVLVTPNYCPFCGARVERREQ